MAKFPWFPKRTSRQHDEASRAAKSAGVVLRVEAVIEPGQDAELPAPARGVPRDDDVGQIAGEDDRPTVVVLGNLIEQSKIDDGPSPA